MSAHEKNILHTSHDKTFIEVADSGEFRSLYFKDSIVQSRIMRDHPHRLILRYTQYMMGISLLACPNPSRILLIGIGAGALLQFLAHHFPDCRISAVDYSEQVIQVARGFFSLPEGESISVHCDDGLCYLRENCAHGAYDLILIDAFNDTGMAKNIYSSEFFRIAMESLSGRGVVTCNLWSGNEKAFQRVKKAITKNCGEALFIPVKQRENVISVLFQKSAPWKKLCPAKPVLKSLSHRYSINFSHISAETGKHNLKLGERIQLWLQ